MRFIDIFVRGLFAADIVSEADFPLGWQPDPYATLRGKLRQELEHFELGVLAALAISSRGVEIGLSSQSNLELPFSRQHGLNRLIDEAVGALIWEIEEYLGRHRRAS